MKKTTDELLQRCLERLDAVTAIIVLVDHSGTVLETSRALAGILNRDPADIIGKKWSEFFDAPLPKAHETEGDVWPLAEDVTLNGETYRVCSFACSANGGTSMLHVMRSITKLQILGEQLLCSDKLSLIGRLVSGIAHDINNPLTGIMAYTELLKARVVNEEIVKDLKKILDSAVRCKRIVENLLGFARDKTPSKTLESVNSLVDRTVELRNYWLKLHNIEVTKDYGEVHSIFVDSQQIQEALLNVLVNAEQAIACSGKGNGKILLVTRCDRETHKVFVKVVDNGPGIPKEVLPRIYEPFFSTKPAGVGTGLGLSIAQSAILAHDGTIVAENNETDGASFTIEIPVGIEGEAGLKDAVCQKRCLSDEQS